MPLDRDLIISSSGLLDIGGINLAIVQPIDAAEGSDTCYCGETYIEGRPSAYNRKWDIMVLERSVLF
jgi:hypothetical protein